MREKQQLYFGRLVCGRRTGFPAAMNPQPLVRVLAHDLFQLAVQGAGVALGVAADFDGGIEAQHVFAEISILNKAMNLAMFELLGDANDANKEVEKFFGVSEKDILNEAIAELKESNCSTLYYRSKSK